MSIIRATAMVTAFLRRSECSLFFFVFKMKMECSLNSFIENYANSECLEEIGWSKVPEIDCEGLSTRTEVVIRAVQKLGRLTAGGWFTEPVVLKRQKLFSINPDFQQDVGGCRSEAQIKRLFKKYPVDGGSRKISKMEAKAEFANTVAFNLHMDGLAEYTIPDKLVKTSSDAILLTSRWYTEGHIEEGGDDSLCLTAVGKKLLL